MPMVLPLLIQAAAASVAPPESPPAAATVRIPIHVRKPCEVSPDPDVITVCGKTSDERFRLRPIPLPAGMKPPVDGPGIDFDIIGAHGNAYTTSTQNPGGAIDRRVMVTLSWPF